MPIAPERRRSSPALNLRPLLKRGALTLMVYVTLSGFMDAGGPIDGRRIGVIWGTGLVGTTILSYAVIGVFDGLSGRCLDRRTG
ncbi:hypothetical protein F1188_03575 [Roseospira marina]|uniref:Uncharacterized protein n=1 Tax=Roseospira marina TaxID=140057 RepID=A0A5M6IGX5_9PROT|nr:DUF5368 family protein [Roseospira marina]KAA5606999.1 hypothetical protein F1188_03575 [Roseospira marina]MBB4312819.1 hypothetical protein [Roseospira marina]MBB5086408.1 hypothetical protein [Roseospira marina]